MVVRKWGTYTLNISVLQVNLAVQQNLLFTVKPYLKFLLFFSKQTRTSVFRSHDDKALCSCSSSETQQQKFQMEE